MTARTRLPLVVLLVSLALSLAAAAVVAVTGMARDEARFENAVTSARARIQSRLDTYVTILHSGAALHAASAEVTDEEFRSFIGSFDVGRRFPGVQGIGFAAYLRPGAVDSLERARRAAGHDGFRVWPDSARPIRTAIVHLEPQDERNRAAMGYDMYTDATRREAMAAARDSGRAALSGKVRLVQEITGPEQAGFLIYDPVYEGGRVPATLAERRERLRGYVYSPFRAGDLFAGIFGASPPPVAFRVYDGLSRDDAALLHDSRSDSLADRPDPSRRPDFTHVDTLPLYGRLWTVEYASLPIIEERSGRFVSPAIAVAGVLVSILLFLLTRAEVRARARAERSEQARSRFYAAMSHELRTPLNAIIGYNDLLLAGIYGHLEAQQSTGIERSQRAAHHLLDIVNDVLDLSKIEAGKVELDEGEVQVPALVEDLFTTMRAFAESHGTELRFECAPATKPIVSDARRVRQILLNLVANAIRFGERRPVTVRCRPARGSGVVIEVEDRGVGIPREDQQRIFEEFVQLSNSGGTGTGLGLPISRRLAHLLGGTLEVESEPGRGSTFRVELPVRIPG